MEIKLNVYQKIIEIKKFAKSFKKNGKGYGYKYITTEDVYKAITDKMNAIGLLFIPVSSVNRKSYTHEFLNERKETKTDFVVEGDLVYAWVNTETPEDKHVITFEYYGQQSDISQAYGSGLTYSERYLLLKSLGLPTGEADPDKKPEKDRPYGESKFDKITKILHGTTFTLETVNTWIKAKYGKPIKINDLTEDQFNDMYDALASKIMELANENQS